jgi:type IV pilus assembly protein PilV
MPSKAKQRGVSLLEVLIAVLVLSIGLLGLAALQTQALKNAESSLQRTQATILAYAMLDALRANRNAATAGNYNTTLTCTVPDASATLVANDRHYWFQSLKDTLGNHATTCGAINCTNAGVCTVTVQWSEERAIGGQNNQSIAISSQI